MPILRFYAQNTLKMRVYFYIFHHTTSDNLTICLTLVYKKSNCSVLCMATFPAMANHPEFESYKIGGAVLIAIFITYVFIKPLKTKSYCLKQSLPFLYF